jgi:hypothetical protein
VVVNAPRDNVEFVAVLISVKVALSEDDCHWIVPVFPVSDKAVGVTPEQMV